ncbi:hypothetical protein SNE25_03490 [Mucilaginibacter sabulilitoris]|uniref:Carboxypeptidase-like regulatory domain-containing protein n=1 Tax=Mucilaginibacter sabulilitoris TaxID=1173583 RepID=A0ABZ0TNX5_9SPHI|nr:hypothetical protein [Mucilaginibacter sabulilitoris]WPU94584.1 hypothetical protein SNE25_03490 [Mucilaginibacter sabulilitoris]
MHYRFYLLLIICFCFVLNASAQEFTLKGVISKKSSPERVGQVLIKNLKTNNFMISDDLGWFTVKASAGDTLLFTKEEFTPQKIVVLNNSDMPVYMQPVIKLNEVQVLGQTKKQELNEIMGDYRKQGTFYAGKPPVLSFLANPLTGLYELFGKTPGRARRFANFARGEAEQAEINRRYNVSFVREYTKLPTDSAARKFMNYYTPSYEDLKQWTDYDLIKHMQKSYDFYKNSNDKDALEGINAPSFLKKKDTSLRLSEPGETLKKEKP